MAAAGLVAKIRSATRWVAETEAGKALDGASPQDAGRASHAAPLEKAPVRSRNLGWAFASEPRPQPGPLALDGAERCTRAPTGRDPLSDLGHPRVGARRGGMKGQRPDVEPARTSACGLWCGMSMRRARFD